MYVPSYSILYSHIPYCTIIFHTVPSYSILYHHTQSILYHHIPYCRIVFHTVQHLQVTVHTGLPQQEATTIVIYYSTGQQCKSVYLLVCQYNIIPLIDTQSSVNKSCSTVVKSSTTGYPFKVTKPQLNHTGTYSIIMYCMVIAHMYAHIPYTVQLVIFKE